MEAQAAYLEDEADELEDEATTRPIYVQGLRHGHDISRDIAQDIRGARGGHRQKLQDREDRMSPPTAASRPARCGREELSRRRGHLGIISRIQSMENNLGLVVSKEDARRGARGIAGSRRKHGSRYTELASSGEGSRDENTPGARERRKGRYTAANRVPSSGFRENGPIDGHCRRQDLYQSSRPALGRTSLGSICVLRNIYQASVQKLPRPGY